MQKMHIIELFLRLLINILRDYDKIFLK